MRAKLTAAALLALVAPLAAQFGAHSSSPSAGATDGLNVLFFGNSYTFSNSNPLVNNPVYGGARGIPELVRQVAIAAGQAPPFVKMVYHLGRGYDHHVSPTQASLAEIDEPKLDGETWDVVVLQGFSTRSTDHPYMGNPSKHRVYGLQLFEEVRVGSTNHTLQSPDVRPVLYQTWAREPGHWFYDTSSTWTAGNNIGIGVSNWTGGPIFEDAADMASQVRTTYELTRAWIDEAVPGVATRIAPVGDAWERAGWGIGWKPLYAADHYHAASHGDLITALTLYATVWGDSSTASVIASGNLEPVLAAIAVPVEDALRIAAWVDDTLANPASVAPPRRPHAQVLVDFSTAAGFRAGPEVQPWPGRHYNLISSLSGAVIDAVDVEGRATGIDVVITDSFAGETSGGATGSWQGAIAISGSRYDESAQLDGFFVGNGSGFVDDRAEIEIRGLDPGGRYRVRIHGSRNNVANQRIGTYTAGGRTATLNAAYNLNLDAVFSPLVPDANGTLTVEVTNGSQSNNFGYVNVLTLTRLGPRARWTGAERPTAPRARGGG